MEHSYPVCQNGIIDLFRQICQGLQMLRKMDGKLGMNLALK